LRIFNSNTLFTILLNSLKCLSIFSHFLIQLICWIFFALLNHEISAGTIDTVSVPSAVLPIQPKAIVILPGIYYSNKNFDYPSVYLLHGWSGRYSDWNDHIDLTTLADRFKMIVICADGGYAGWYLDSPYKEKSQYETYIIKEVIPFIQKHYRVSDKAEKRFVCGLSMGGYGALRLISRFPELFGAAGSMSGVLLLHSKLERFGLVELLGDSLSNSRLWQENSCINLLLNLIDKSKGIIIDCGVEDPFIDMNRAVHAYLLKLGLEHEYWERSGAHTWTYWTNALEYHFLFFQKSIQREH